VRSLKLKIRNPQSPIRNYNETRHLVSYKTDGVRSQGLCRPDGTPRRSKAKVGAGFYFGLRFYKDAAPMALDGRTKTKSGLTGN